MKNLYLFESSFFCYPADVGKFRAMKQKVGDKR